MTTFTEIVATVVVHSSAVALSHFGVTMEPAQVERITPPAAERVIARTPAGVQTSTHKVMRLTSCPQPKRPAHTLKV
ncbi:hypothetical protein [Phenylobacterium sp.]|uniref:hypothetical protein n=1 Tax=Phenylobacterium sp. TaxID=1871053 RepID=UPI002B5A5C52|nr:hypothetical protein [Phenylobacterium sp.]HLZ75549.1 hypothetical protein [Phenylobacterium sp.]